MPRPQIRLMAAPAGRRCLHCSSKSLSSAASRSRFNALKNSLRFCPPMSATGIRSPTPSATHQALANTLASSAAPFKRRMKVCSSSMVAVPWVGWVDSTAGPPVENPKSALPLKALPARARSSGLSLKEQRSPGPRSRPKSNTQLRASSQRPWPASAHSMANGVGAFGSPNRTTSSEKRTATWRTARTSPCGEKRSTVTACAVPPAKHASPKPNQTPARNSMFRAPVTLRCPVICLRPIMTCGGSIVAPCGRSIVVTPVARRIGQGRTGDVSV